METWRRQSGAQAGRSKWETPVWESRSHTWHFKSSSQLRVARERAAGEEGSELSPPTSLTFKELENEEPAARGDCKRAGMTQGGSSKLGVYSKFSLRMRERNWLAGLMSLTEMSV